MCLENVNQLVRLVIIASSASTCKMNTKGMFLSLIALIKKQKDLLDSEGTDGCSIVNGKNAV